jgi:LacI family transcriptional regulator
VPRNVTLRDVALEAGVDVSTASRALDPVRAHLVAELTRKKVLRAAAALGYVRDERARALRRGKTDTVGVIVADLINPYAGDVFQGIENALYEKGMMALLTETQDEPTRLEQILAHLLQRRVDGLIITAATSENSDLIAKLRGRLPLVLALRYLPDVDVPAVVFDERYGAALIAQHFASRRRTRVVQLCGPPGVSTFDDREAGFAAECTRLGLETSHPHLRTTRPNIDGGRQLMEQVLRDGQAPEAVFAHNDLMAIGALQAIREAGLRCPEDVAVVGYDDIIVAEHTRPPLSTVRVPAVQLGRTAAEMLLSIILSKNGMPSRVSLAPTFVERGSG